jgi:hypothetical protein
MGRACSSDEREEECIAGFGGKIRRKETTTRPRRKCDHNIKMKLREVGWEYGLNSSGSG